MAERIGPAAEEAEAADVMLEQLEGLAEEEVEADSRPLLKPSVLGLQTALGATGRRVVLSGCSGSCTARSCSSVVQRAFIFWFDSAGLNSSMPPSSFCLSALFTCLVF